MYFDVIETVCNIPYTQYVCTNTSNSYIQSFVFYFFVFFVKQAKKFANYFTCKNCSTILLETTLT